MHYKVMVTPANIRAARAKLKESQQVFAERFGVDQSTIHRWETAGIPDRGTTAFAVERVIRDLAIPAPEKVA